METDYFPYYKQMVQAFYIHFMNDGMKEDLAIVLSHYKSYLALVRNNIFFTITRYIKMVKFYKLDWSSGINILGDYSAFRRYVIRNIEKQNKEKLNSFNSNDAKLKMHLQKMRSKPFYQMRKFSY